jgi:3D (Asp-Asp-Asp) domain-containing protein
VVEPGQLGIYASRERVRYADGAEIWRDSDGTWQASEAKDGVLGYGTEIVVQSEVVDGITIEYWRKKSVYATYYVPCDAYGNCYTGTASGYPVRKGIVAVMPWWYSVPEGLAMADLQVYVQGYGEAIIGDVCGGCSGNTPWIDLAFGQDDEVNWVNGWTTMYFLTPVPERYIPPIITP